MLSRLAKQEWGSYEVIRHRIAAHRQPLATDSVADIEAATRAWNDITQATLYILAEDTRTIWNALADGTGLAHLEGLPPIDPEMSRAIAERGYEVVPQGLAAGFGSFDATRADAVPAVQGGELGTALRLIVDGIRAVQVLSQLFGAVNGYEPYAYVVASAVHVEACTLHDVLLGQAVITPAQYKSGSLREILARTDAGSPGLPPLTQATTTMPPAEMVKVRWVRDRIGAHIDDRLPLSGLLDLLRHSDPAPLNQVIDHLFVAISDAAAADIHLRPALLADAHLRGLQRLDEPEGHMPYEG